MYMYELYKVMGFGVPSSQELESAGISGSLALNAEADAGEPPPP